MSIATKLLSAQSASTPDGEAVFTSSMTWTAPAGITEVCVVCVGGGHTSSWDSGSGTAGGGGGLGWANYIPVTPNQEYTVVVGSGTNSRTTLSTIKDSYFIDLSTVAGLGGNSGIYGGAGGSYVGDGGGNGGNGGTHFPNLWGGGGGAGGYSGNGGDGGDDYGGNGFAGSGGAGGGGLGYRLSGFTGGGGVGIYGEGSSGAAGGYGGSGGGNASGKTPGAYGGGGAVSGASAGVVRIIWGDGRYFPSTNTSAAFSEIVFLNNVEQV